MRLKTWFIAHELRKHLGLPRKESKVLANIFGSLRTTLFGALKAAGLGFAAAMLNGSSPKAAIGLAIAAGVSLIKGALEHDGVFGSPNGS